MFLLLLLVAIIFVAVLFWLRIYTNHGQKLELPNFVGMQYDKGADIADDKSFQLIISDSIHIVNKQGGEIIDQNPEAFSKVKENRKVYVTTTKYNADLLKVASLGVLYGQEYESKKAELKHLSINSTIRSYIFDPGEPNHILEVYYEGKPIVTRGGRSDHVEIKKGGTLEFVLSSKGGGTVEIPNCKCNTYGGAKFLIEASNLVLGEVREQGEILDRNTAYVSGQYPPYVPGKSIGMNEPIALIISQAKPLDCK